MFKIGDFSRLSRISVKALRYYDEIGLLKPVKVDQFTGYRYYSADQLPRLHYIIALKDTGLSLEEIATLVNNSLSPSQMRDIFILKQAELRQRLSEEKKRLEQVEKLLQQIEKEGKMPDYKVVVKKVEPQKFASIREVLPTYPDMGRLFEEIFSYLQSKGAKIAGPPIFVCHEPEFKEKDVDVEVGFPIAGHIPGNDRIKVYELPGIEAACLVYTGNYSDGLQERYTAIMNWIENNGYQITGPDRELYLTSPYDTKDPTKYVTEIQFPVAKTPPG